MTRVALTAIVPAKNSITTVTGSNCRLLLMTTEENGDKRLPNVLGTIRAVLMGMDFEYNRPHGKFPQSLIKSRAREAEKKLLLAVLENAIEDFHKYAAAKDRKGALLFQEAQKWIQEKNSQWFLSFDRICQSLSLRPDHLRRDLLRRQQPNFDRDQ